MISFTAKFKKFELPPLTIAAKHAVGEAAIEAEHDRISDGVNLADLSAKPLVPRYKAIKEHLGGKPIRDLTLTGDLLKSRRVESVAGNEVVVAFGDDRETEKAQRNDAIEPMTGLSERDQEKVSSEFRKVYP